MDEQAFEHWHANGMEALMKIDYKLELIHSCLGDKDSPLLPLSFRDQCAISAMAALITTDKDWTNSADFIAKVAYEQADAMNEARQTIARRKEQHGSK